MNTAPLIDAQAIGPVVCDAFAWRHGGRMRLTAVVKATFALRNGEPMALSEPEPLVEVELHHKNNPLYSVRATFDYAPFVPRADVVLVGDACAPGGTPVRELGARLALFRADRALIDRTIRVRGDRTARGPGAFRRLPLIYELAYGGIGLPANPLGIGVEGSSERWANLLDPKDEARPACFAPLGRGWPARRRMLTAPLKSALAAELPDLPPDADFGYFHCAPEEQRCDHLRGDERLVLEGVHPAHPRIDTALPGIAAQARAIGARAVRAVPLVADLLFIDAVAEQATLTWRGAIDVAEDEVLAVLGALQIPGLPIPWPAFAESRRSATSPLAAIAAGGDPARATMATTLAATFVLSEKRPGGDLTLALESLDLPDPTATAALSPDEQARASVRRALPGGWLLRSPGAQTTEPPWILSGVRAVPAPSAHEGTLLLLDEPRAAPAPIAEAREAEDFRWEWLPARKNEVVPILGDERLAAATIPWKLRPPRCSRTVVIKASCDIVPGARARLRDEPDVLCGDLLPNAIDATPRYPSDLAPFKPAADVVLHGFAYARTARVRGAPVGHARFAFGRRGAADPQGERWFDRSVAVFGDRRWSEALATRVPGEPACWERMPLTYERAFGGPGTANPRGLGRGDFLPNLEDPARLLRRPGDTPAPVCFAALPLFSPERREKLGSYGGDWASARWPYFPDDFEWSSMQSAPPEQRLPYLAGNEPFALCGVHPEIAVLQGELPGLRPRCFAQQALAAAAAARAAAGGAPGRSGWFEVRLALDTAVFDADAMQLSLVWRGVLEVADTDASDLAALWVGLEEPGDAPLTAERARERFVAELAAKQPIAPHGLFGSAGPQLRPESAPAAGPDPQALRAEVSRRVAAGEPLADLDLTGADLSGLDLSSQSLARSRLSGAALRGCRLAHANLASADLAGCDLSDAFAERADFSKADLTGAKLAGAKLGDATLVSARLFDACADRAALDRADLTGLRADDASFAGASLRGARLDRASLDGAKLAGAKLAAASLRQAGLSRALLARADLAGADLTEARLGRANLAGAALRGSNLKDATLESADLRGADLRDCNLYGVNAQGAQIADLRVEGALLAGSTLGGGS